MAPLLLPFLAILLLGISTTCAEYNWQAVNAVLTSGITSRIYPGATALVADHSGPLYTASLGTFTYEVPPPAEEMVTLETVYDLASLTKVLASTTAIMVFYQRGLIDLDWRIADNVLLGPEFAANGKNDITVRSLLLHNSGLPAGPSPSYCKVSHPTFFSSRFFHRASPLSFQDLWMP